MRTIAIANQKGGVGKSSTAQSIGAGLIRLGFKVLFIDLDAQGNLSYSMGADTQKGYNSLGILQRPETTASEIQHTAQGDIIASTPALIGADAIFTDIGREYLLKEALSTVSNKYDICVIDTPPALSVLTVNALTACTEALIPSQADIYSMQGITQLSNTISTVKKYCNSDLYIIGILLTRYNSRSVLSKQITEVTESVAEQMGTTVFNSKIRECTAIREAQAMQKDIFTYSPKSHAAEDYAALVKEIMERESKR